jgi:hypothetical protein
MRIISQSSEAKTVREWTPQNRKLGLSRRMPEQLYVCTEHPPGFAMIRLLHPAIPPVAALITHGSGQGMHTWNVARDGGPIHGPGARMASYSPGHLFGPTANQRLDMLEQSSDTWPQHRHSQWMGIKKAPSAFTHRILMRHASGPHLLQPMVIEHGNPQMHSWSYRNKTAHKERARFPRVALFRSDHGILMQ